MELAHDQQLVGAMEAGDPDAIAALYDLHAPAMLGLAVRILRDRRDAEDLVHDVFVEAAARPRSAGLLLERTAGTVRRPAARRSERASDAGGDPAGFPNGRRTTDDVTDCFLRAGFGILIPQFDTFPFNRLGDGVNVNDNPVPDTFPFMAAANSRHVDPAEPGCAGGTCPVN